MRNFAPDDDEDEDDNDGMDENSESFRQAAYQWFPEVTEPQKAGVELLRSGDFGRVADKLRSRRSDINLPKLIYKRSMRPEPVSYKEDFASVRISDTTSSMALMFRIESHTQFQWHRSCFLRC
jgi:WD repeat-containing protein 23